MGRVYTNSPSGADIKGNVCATHDIIDAPPRIEVKNQKRLLKKRLDQV
jgi:hypothetical protein